MEVAGVPSWERRDLVRLGAPLLPLGLIYFLYTDAHLVLGVVLNVDGAVFLGLAGALLICWFLLVRRAPRGIGSNWRGTLWIVAIVLQGLAALFTLGAMVFSSIPAEVLRRPLPGGRTVAILYSSVMQGQVATLAEVAFDVPLVHGYRPVVSMNTDSPHAGSLLVRPEGHGQGEDWQIHVAPDGLVTGFYWNMLCVVAWDPVSGKTWGMEGEPIGKLPAFFLIGKEGGLVAEDTERLVKEATEKARERKKYAEEGIYTSPPDPWADSDFRDALTHPNPAVRAAARRVVDAGGPAVYPEASKVPR